MVSKIEISPDPATAAASTIIELVLKSKLFVPTSGSTVQEKDDPAVGLTLYTRFVSPAHILSRPDIVFGTGSGLIVITTGISAPSHPSVLMGVM